MCKKPVRKLRHACDGTCVSAVPTARTRNEAADCLAASTFQLARWFDCANGFVAYMCFNGHTASVSDGTRRHLHLGTPCAGPQGGGRENVGDAAAAAAATEAAARGSTARKRPGGGVVPLAPGAGSEVNPPEGPDILPVEVRCTCSCGRTIMYRSTMYGVRCCGCALLHTRLPPAVGCGGCRAHVRFVCSAVRADALARALCIVGTVAYATPLRLLKFQHAPGTLALHMPVHSLLTDVSCPRWRAPRSSCARSARCCGGWCGLRSSGRRRRAWCSASGGRRCRWARARARARWAAVQSIGCYVCRTVLYLLRHRMPRHLAIGMCERRCSDVRYRGIRDVTCTAQHQHPAHAMSSH